LMQHMVVVPIISHLYINKGVSHVLKPIIKSTIMASSYTNPKAKVHTPTPKHQHPIKSCHISIRPTSSATSFYIIRKI
jgi:hypothetical protein